MLIDHSISCLPAGASYALGGPGTDDVGDRLDHVLEVLPLGLVVRREVKLIQRVTARAPAASAARRQPQGSHDDQAKPDRDLNADQTGQPE